MNKWRLVLKTLPWVALVLALTYLRDYVLDIRSLVDFTDIGAVITGAALIIGFMLAGVIGDYKESEKLPGELAAGLEAIDDAIVSGSRGAKPFEAAEFRLRYSEIAGTICDWFLNRRGVGDCYGALRHLNDLIADLERAGLGAVFAARCLAEQHNVRKLVTRIDVIRRTNFIQTGYALLQMFVWTTMALLIFSNFKNWLVQFLVVGTLSLIYIYLLRLIRDLDDPFEYTGGYQEGRSADVNPYPVTDFRARFEASLSKQTSSENQVSPARS
jgi:hypothetical protein